MSIQGSILNHNILRHTDTERSKVPYGFNSSCNHSIRNLLRYLNGHSQHTDIDVIFLHFLFKLIRVINGNSIQRCSYQSGIHIKSSYNLQTEMAQSRVTQQSTTQTSDTKRKALCILVNPRKSSSTAISVSTS